MLKLMALAVLRDISSNLQSANFYTIMVDECADTSNNKQLVIVLRWVDDQLNPHEEFIGLYEVPTIQASTIASAIKDTLIRLNLSLTRARGQCYDGASNMRGSRNGVAKIIQDCEPRAIFSHCYGHALNLATGDAIRNCQLMKATLETTYEITKLVKYSPRREGLFDKLKSEMAPEGAGIRVLCPTRWTVRADSMNSIIRNYAVLQELWERSAELVRDTETIARIRGVSAQMHSFDYFCGLLLGEMLLRHCDNLSKALQSSSLSAAEGQAIADMTKKTLIGLRTEEKFDLFWERVNRMSQDVEVSDPALPRKRKAPRRYEVGEAPAEFHSTPKSLYRQIYYEVLDLIVNAIEDRFNQPGYQVYRQS